MHSSWKTTLLVAVVGCIVFLAAGLIPGWGAILVVLALLVFRPAMEVYFSNQCYCPHCEYDLFLEVCAAESADGVEQGLRCPQCGEDAATISAMRGPVIDVD